MQINYNFAYTTVTPQTRQQLIIVLHSIVFLACVFLCPCHRPNELSRLTFQQVLPVLRRRRGGVMYVRCTNASFANDVVVRHMEQKFEKNKPIRNTREKPTLVCARRKNNQKINYTHMRCSIYVNSTVEAQLNIHRGKP